MTFEIFKGEKFLPWASRKWDIHWKYPTVLNNLMDILILCFEKLLYPQNVIYELPQCLDRNEMTPTTLTFGIYVCLSAYSPYYDDSNCIVARRPKLFPVSNGQIKQLPREVHEISTISHTHKCLLDMKIQKFRFLSATNFISFYGCFNGWASWEQQSGNIRHICLKVMMSTLAGAELKSP